MYSPHNNNITDAISCNYDDNDNKNKWSNENVNSSDDKTKCNECTTNNAYKTQNAMMCDDQIDKNKKDKPVHSLCKK